MTLDEMIAVLQAAKEEKLLEWRDKDNINSCWTPIGMPTWNFHKYDYRIKPQPREYWVNLYRNGAASKLYATRFEADRGRSVSMQFVACLHLKEIE